MLHKAFLLMFAVMLFSAIRLAQAQDAASDPPLLMSGVVGEESHDYRLYRYVADAWEEIPTQDMGQASLSPDGRWLVYQRVPPFLKTLEEGTGLYYGTAWDLVLVDMQEGTEQVIAEQPVTIVAHENGTGYTGGINRGVPVWSNLKDSFAWIEQDYPAQETARLMSYSSTTHRISQKDTHLPFTRLSANGLPNILSWTSVGIVVFTHDPEDSVPTIRLYPEQGNRVIVRLTDSLDAEWWPWAGFIGVAMVNGDAVYDVAVFPGIDAWYSVPSQGNDPSPIASKIEGYSGFNDQGGPRFVWNAHPEKETLGQWQIVTGSGQEIAVGDVAETGMRPPLFALAPSGQAVAYVANNEVRIWQDGEAKPIPLPKDVRVTALFWGSVQWVSFYRGQ